MAGIDKRLPILYLGGKSDLSVLLFFQYSNIMSEKYFKSELQQLSFMSGLRKPTRPLLPLNDNQPSPDIHPKFNTKAFGDLNSEPYSNPHRQFAQNPLYYTKKIKTDEQLSSFSLSELNIELDNNLNDIISIIGKRKLLVAAKKNKMLEELQHKLHQTRNNPKQLFTDVARDEEFLKIVSFCQHPQTAVRMLGKIIQTVPEIKGPRIDEEERSEQFWARNRKLENDIDNILQKLKTIDKQLQKENVEVADICRELDRIEDTLKSFVGAKSPEHVAKVEPLFNSKKKNYDFLNRRIKEREVSKDKKIQFIKRIKNILEQLKRTREERLQEIALFFGIDNTCQFDKMNLKDQGDFANSLEQLLKIKERDSQLQVSERQVFMEIDLIEKEEDRIYNELLQRTSDEARAFMNLNSVHSERIRNTSILALFQNQTTNFSFKSIDSKEYLKKFKEVRNFFKRFLEEDALLKQGLVKTSQTTKTFVTLLRSTQNEKERRHQLLSLLQTCIKKRAEYQQKRDEIRNLQFEQSRNYQELTQFEEDLEAVLTDGDLDGYKMLGSAINKCEDEKLRLNQVKELIQKQMDSMDREVVSLANRIQDQYQDILSDILPSDYEYSLRSGEDVKKLRNQLRRMYKRLGLLSSE